MLLLIQKYIKNRFACRLQTQIMHQSENIKIKLITIISKDEYSWLILLYARVNENQSLEHIRSKSRKLLTARFAMNTHTHTHTQHIKMQSQLSTNLRHITIWELSDLQEIFRSNTSYLVVLRRVSHLPQYAHIVLKLVTSIKLIT